MKVTETGSFEVYNGFGGVDLPNTPNDVQNAWSEMTKLSMDGNEFSDRPEYVEPAYGFGEVEVAGTVAKGVNTYDIAGAERYVGQVTDDERALIDELNVDLEKIAPEGHKVYIDIDADSQVDGAVGSDSSIEVVDEKTGEEPEPEAVEQETREGGVEKLRERLKLRSGFLKKVEQAVQGMAELVRSKLQGSKEQDEAQSEEVQTEVVQESEKVIEDEADKVEDVVDTAVDTDMVAEEGVSEEELEQEYQEVHGEAQAERYKNMERLEGVKSELKERMWATRDNLMQERFAQMVDEVEAKILAIRAAIVMVERQEQMRFRPRTEMENHGQFALEYLRENGIFEGSYDEEGLEELLGLKESLEFKVVKATIEHDDLSRDEYVTQLEYVRPAVRELERALKHPEEWKKMKIIRTDQIAG